MTWWQTYGSFLIFAVVVIVVPGPDFAVVTKNSLSSGRRSDAWASFGVATSNAVQGVVAVVGLGALVVASQPVFTTIKWAGMAYLGFLGVQALRSAWRGQYSSMQSASTASERRTAVHGWRQGFLSNITNPKVLGLAYLLLLVTGLHRARRFLTRRPVRRGLDAGTGIALLGFSARLAREQG